MKTLSQHPSLRQAFKQQIDKSIAENRAATQSELPEGWASAVGGFLFDVNQFSNQFKGSLGEGIVSLLLKFIPDSYILFNNAFIPTKIPGRLTEIDHLIIGPAGVFLVELKTWKGSFSAHRDRWQRREGNRWVAISSSPSSQSAYHLQMFRQWIVTEVDDLPEDCISAPVVFTVAQWVGVTQCAVPVLHGIQPLFSVLNNSPIRLNAAQVDRIADAVANYRLPEPGNTPKPKPKPTLKRSGNSAKPTVVPKTYTMNEGVGVAQQATADITQWLCSLPQTIAVENVENDPNYQQIDVDLLLTTTKGQFKLEIKGDRWHKTGNFFFETYSNFERGTPGCFIYTEADWLCYYFITPRELYLLPMPTTREWFLENLDRFRERSTTTPIQGGGHYTTVGRLVAIATVRQEVADIRKIQL